MLVVTAKVDILCADLGLKAGHGRPGKGDKSLRTDAETGESGALGARYRMVGEHRQKRYPRPDLISVLLRHDSRYLSQMP